MKGGRIGVRVLIGVILLWTVVPLAWMVLTSLKPADKLTSNPPTLVFKPTSSTTRTCSTTTSAATRSTRSSPRACRR